MRKSINAGFGAALIWGCLFLAGCAMSPERRESLDPSKLKVQEGSGLLAARVVTHTSIVPINLGAATLRLRSVPEGTTFNLESKATASSIAGVFFDTLPPGRYQPISLAAGNMTAPVEKQLGEFVVEPDTVTDLGAFVIAFDSVGPMGGKYRVALMDTPKETQALLDALPANTASRLRGKQVLKIIPNNPADNQAILNRARANAAISSRTMLEDGKPIIFGRSMGMFTIWDPVSDGWKHVDTGSSFPVTSVLQDTGDSQLLGLQEGLLLEHKHGALNYLPSPMKGAMIVSLAKRSNGEYVAVLEGRNDYLIVSSANPRLGEWRVLKRIPYDRQYAAQQTARMKAWVAKDHAVLIAIDIGWSVNVTIHSVNLQTGELQTYAANLTTISGVGGFDVLSDGTIIAGGGSAFNPTIFRSFDWGKSWSKTPLENWSGFPIARNSKVFYGIRVDKLGVFNPGDLSLWRSEDEGVSWGQQGAIPKYMSQIYVLPKQSHLLLETWIGDAYISRDDGKTWQLRH